MSSGGAGKHGAMPRPTRPRIVPRSRAEQVRRTNLRIRWLDDVYHRALALPWWGFLGLGCCAYLVVNFIFAALYWMQPGSIGGAHPDLFSDAFFFSVQTIATIGYGQMFPATFYANVLVTMETMAGLVILALATGITFARISRPTARVMFARHPVVGPQNGVPTLSIRIANERRSQILEADVTVSLLRLETTAEGDTFRRFYDLRLLRSHTPVFALSFTLMHPIDPGSPLWGKSPSDLVAEDAQILVSVTGLEEVASQTVHARISYDAEEVRYGCRYADIFVQTADGLRAMDFSMFHTTIASAQGTQAPAEDC